jgi:hypothetical protein
MVSEFKKMPMIKIHSNITKFQIQLKMLTIEQLKGLAGKVNVMVTGKKKDILVASVAKKMYFGFYAPLMLSDYFYYNHLDRIITGIDLFVSLNQYLRDMRRNEFIIIREVRDYNINRLELYEDRYFSQFSSIDIPSFMETLASIRRGDIESHFGAFITIEDIYRYVPIIRVFIETRIDDIDAMVNYIFGIQLDTQFEDIILQQNLDLKCEYIKELPLKKREEDCIICLSNRCDTVLNCDHMYCIDCVMTTIQMSMDDHRRKLTCALCREEITTIKTMDDIKITNLARLIG